MAVHRVKKERVKEMVAEGVSDAGRGVSDAAMASLARVMNDSVNVVKLGGTEWSIRALRPGVQWLISEEACKIVDNEGLSLGDVVVEIGKNLPLVCKIITLALLNDRDRIFEGGVIGVYSEEYRRVYDVLMWGDYGVRDWAMLLGEILGMLDTAFFFESIRVAKMFRTATLEKKGAV